MLVHERNNPTVEELRAEPFCNHDGFIGKAEARYEPPKLYFTRWDVAEAWKSLRYRQDD